MIEAIFWDNDGILVDTEALYFRASAEVLKAAGISLSRAEFIAISLQHGGSVFALAEARGHGRDAVEDMRRQRDARYADLLRRGISLLPGVRETLAMLHGKVRMGVVTGSRRAHFAIIHRSTGLLPFFDFILDREDFVHSKPHPEPYLKALAVSGLRPEQCIVVEDSERGLHAAVAAGLRCLVVPSGLTAAGDFSRAAKVLRSVAEVIDYILPEIRNV